jgi:hypothetical protein
MWAALALSVALAPGPPAPVRGCEDGVGGRVVTPDPATDTIVGPLSLTGLPGAYRAFLESPGEPVPGLGIPGIKALARLRASARVTLVVPRRQRDWLKLVYHRRVRAGQARTTLQACRHGRYTQFPGGVAVDLDAAPRSGLCAELIVHVRGRERPLRERLFAPQPGDCD